jgi:L-cysteine desulfidase
MTLSSEDYLKILKSELLLALGCTEPTAIALCAAKAREILGCVPQTIEVFCSGNVLKNAFSVTVPNSNGKKGIDIAAALGACGGDAKRGLEVLETVQTRQIEAAQKMVDDGFVSVQLSEGVDNLYIRCLLKAQDESAEAIIAGHHTHFVLLKRNDSILFSAETFNEDKPDEDALDSIKSQLNVKDIYDFALLFDPVEFPEINQTLEQQVSYNSRIAEEGIQGAWGQQVGRTILKNPQLTDAEEITAYTASGSDARMSGCAMPVVIVSGSGNQGMTVSNPIIRLAKQLGSSEKKRNQALLFASLVAIHEKFYIGDLSAYCGAITAGAAAAGGMAFLRGFSFDKIEQAILNTLAVSSGIICDGAKPSCAAKIAIAVSNAQLAVNMAQNEQVFQPGDGIIGADLEETIRNIGRLARQGMAETDRVILKIMLNSV